MPRFLITVTETRTYSGEVLALDEHDARELAEDLAANDEFPMTPMDRSFDVRKFREDVA